jgi:hypothetical protein
MKIESHEQNGPSGPKTENPTAPPSGVSAPADDETGLLLRLEIAPSHTVTFYEPRDGQFIIVERMPRDHRSVMREPDSHDGVALFQRLRPGRSVPSALQQAYDRARQAALAGPTGAVRAGGLSVGGGEPASTVVPARKT